MRQAYRILPVYSGDVSGVCSALYELGGMTVMHDPSGCNSTYNTHDELRWYDRDSLIFLSGLKERDAIFGNDAKLVEDICVAAEEFRPAFIAICSSPIPFINGTDLVAIAAMVEKRTGIPCFSVPTNGAHDYVAGAGAAFQQLARRVPEPKERVRRSVNLLGLTPLDFAAAGETAALRTFLQENGWQVCSCWAMEDTLSSILSAGQAAVNLVASSVGFPAAQTLQKRFKTPFVAGLPIHGMEDAVLRALETAAETGESSFPCRFRGTGEPGTLFIGESVTMGSAAAALCSLTGEGAQLVCPLEGAHELLAPEDLRTRGEEEVAHALKRAKRVVADPFYRELVPESAEFLPMPQLAFSGRTHLKQVRSFLSLWKEPCKWE